MAVLKSAVPGKTMADIESALSGGATDLGAAGPDNDSGAGLVDVVNAYMLLSGSTPPDADQDGVPDGSDLCPATPSGESVDADGCSASQRDSDGDGVSDAQDLCPGTPAGTAVDTDGCEVEPPPGEGSIVVTQASYNAARDKVSVWATSDLGKQADLSVIFTLEDGSVTNSIGMAWKKKNRRWESSIRRFVRTYGSAPVAVTVSGPEGEVTTGL
jgi:hypothetical protein